MDKISKKALYSLLAILALASFFRFFDLGRADVVYDESINSFRALGYLDFFGETGQQTVLDWFSVPPAWTKLGFADHPFLSFLGNFIFLNVFGPSAWATRILSALAGVLSVVLIYLLSKRLFDSKVALAASLVMAINSLAVFIARIGLQESLLIALGLASLYFFVRSFEEGKFLYWSATFLGLAMLTKYTAIFLVPAYLILIFIYRPQWFKQKNFYLAILVFIVVFLPAIIFNTLLFVNFGHFDLQLSTLLGLQGKVLGWDKVLGQNNLDFFSSLGQLPKNLILYLSPLFLAVLAVAAVNLIFFYKKNKFGVAVLALNILWLTLLLGVIGPQERFLTMLVPFFSIIIAVLFASLLNGKKYYHLVAGLLILFCFYESFYTINTFFNKISIASAPYFYSDTLSRLRGDWGFNKLEKYLDQELGNKVPALRFQLANDYLEQRVNKSLDNKDLPESAALIIYDFNLKDGPDIWYIKRWQFYNGWPIITADNFLKEISEQGSDYFAEIGFDTFYFIQATNNSLLRPFEDRSPAGKELGDELIKIGLVPVEIKNSKEELSILVFKWQ